MDSSGNAYITGRTFAANFPTTFGAFRTASSGNPDAFVTRIGFTPSTTTTVLTVSKSIVEVGGSVTLTAAFSSPVGTPIGTLTFLDGSTLLSLLPLVVGGQSFTTSLLTEGAHTLTAQFTPINGEAFAASTSNAVTVRVVTFGDIPLLSGGNTFTGNQTVNGTVSALNFSGNGSGLTNLNPANIGPGAAAINITGTAATALIATSAMTAMNATNLGGVPATKYARLDLGNIFSGNQIVTGDVSTSGDLATAGSLLIGGGTAIKQYVSATFAITMPSLKPNSCTQITQTLQAVGAGTNDTVALGVPNSFMSVGGFIVFQAWENSPNTIKIRICNLSPTGPASAAATGMIRVDLFKH